MASRQVLLLAAAAAAIAAVAFLPAPASAAEVFMVGGEVGWTLKYPANWTEGKTFKVGDSLMFMYPAGNHTVVEVTGADFKACSAKGNNLGLWATGKDSVPLDKAGRRWFICGVGDHCGKGMKLLVVTDGAAAPAPSPGPLTDGAAAPAPSPGPPRSSSATSVVTGAVSQAAMAVTGVVATAVLML